MKTTYVVENVGKVTLTDKDYLASGGEASIYIRDKTAYKIYHEVSKMIPSKKIEELRLIKCPNVLIPLNVVRNERNVPVGYGMRYVKNTVPLCKLFTKIFRSNNKITDDDIVKLVKEIQITIDNIHKTGCLIVDLNELNILTSDDFKIPYFIDTDSYHTPSFKATAIMESIRDPLVKGNNFTDLSDWFSFGVLAAYLYIGVHPYKGIHPNYKPNELAKRMKDGISIFDKNVSLPRVCNSFSVIPPLHRSWLESLFVKNLRSKPPMVDAVVTIISIPDITIESTADFETSIALTLPEKIHSIFNFMGVNYFVGDKHLFKETAPLPNDVNGYSACLCESSDMSPVICKLKNGLLTFEDIGSNHIAEMNANQMMYKNGAIYSIYDNKLMENTFLKMAGKVIHSTRLACNILDLSTKVFDGVVFQDLLGKCHITLPYEKGKCAFMPIKEMNGYRLLEAKAEANICVAIGEKKGKYARFILTFDKGFTSYKISITDDVTYSPVNFTVLPNGVCIMATDSEVCLFKDGKAKIILNPPFDANTKLVNFSGDVYFIDGNKLYYTKVKK